MNILTNIDMKCCGNCKHYEMGTISEYEVFGNTDSDSPIIQISRCKCMELQPTFCNAKYVCNKWEFDEMEGIQRLTEMEKINKQFERKLK